jgi:acetyl-CoA synthetase
MARLTEYTSYADAHRHFSSAALWELFDGDRRALNIAHECVDRWAGASRCASRTRTSATRP